MLLPPLLLLVAALFLLPLSASGGVEEDVRQMALRYLKTWQSVSEENIRLLMSRNNSCEDFQCFILGVTGLSFCNEDYCKTRNTDDKLNHMVKKHIQRVMSTCNYTPQHAIKFIVNIRDEPMQLRKEFNATASTQEAPMFSFQTSSDHHDVPIDYSRDHFDQKLEIFVQRLSEISNSSSSIPWEERLPILFWRGSQTGGWYTVNNWKEFARSKLVLMSKESPDKIDAAFSTWTQVYPKARRVMNRAVGLGNTVPLEHQGRWRYLASLDGNGWASRLPFLMALGSLVFKQESDFFTWWYPLLKPFHHYVPIVINNTWNDVFEKVDWANKNDAQARKIAETGRNFVSQYLIQNADVYMCQLLKEYSKIFI